MRINKTGLLATAVLMTVAGFVGGSHPAMAAGDSVTINITGRVKDVTCTLNDIAAPILPEISAADFGGTAGIEVGSVSIPVTFSNCGGDTSKIAVKVSGTNDDDDKTGLVFKSTGDATGVGVVLYDTDGLKFKTDGTSNGVKIPVDKTGHTASTTYTAKYISTKDEVKSGAVSTVVTFEFTYT
ncbi:fimbrial protein [Pantoea agglomerans]|uniref:fimbrial protein n=1 Tax=Enterobacter agglomerans TaxID=549 RepID=UPI0024139EF0|nr:fimbrial protein [Pantoea agglomerans]